MGLKEKRFTKIFQEEQFPDLQQQILEALGNEVPMEIEWETLFEERFIHLYSETYPKIYFIPLIEAFKAIGVDDLGKEALKEGIHKIVICNKNDHHNPERAYTISEGVLTVDHSPVLNADKVEERISVLQQVIENSL
ncbi:hypothetical protein ACFSTE_14020 [Aquimarina hainanensis]|uniref:Uncharacterized protein n=1 Tax=Aquimarina hainanensis TaxID=1578017 RepID=A0ABW5N8K6_9FLAO|nr:hypothetical protein [Aquimarina sp. TRL1]QKX03997.1 hypothetical protein HN014_03455 [Aquimarina sp. TRL1]